MKRAFWKKVLALILWVSLTAYPAFCSTYFVATNGNDTTGNGTIGLHWKTISPKAVGAVHAGDTIYVRGGTYTYTGSSRNSRTGQSPSQRRWEELRAGRFVESRSERFSKTVRRPVVQGFRLHDPRLP